jgi:AcrR family transcriptional regulator
VIQERKSSRIRRRAVLAAALECFSEADVESVSIAEICARSNTSVGSVYHHFGSKEGIVVALIADGLAAHTDALQQALEQTGGDPQQGIAAVVSSLIEWIEDHPGWAMFIYANLNSSGASAAEPIRNINRRYAEIIDGFFGPLIDTGQMRDLPRECWSSLIAAPVHDYARRWLRGQIRPSPSAQRRVFIDAAWRIIKP